MEVDQHSIAARALHVSQELLPRASITHSYIEKDVLELILRNTRVVPLGFLPRPADVNEEVPLFKKLLYRHWR